MSIKFHSKASLLRRMSILSLTILLSAFTAAAQTKNTVTFPNDRVSIGQVMHEIERQANITFLFDSRTFDTTRMVSLERRQYPIIDAIKLLAADTDYSILVQKDYVVINSEARPATTSKSKALPQRTSDHYTPSGSTDSIWIERPVIEHRSQAPTSSPSPAKEYPAPHSIYVDADLYAPMQSLLPHWAIKTNVLYGVATLTPNLSVEIATGPKTTIELTGSYNPWNWEGSYTDNKKHVHYVVQPEFRWWMCERFNGHFLGAHLLFSQFNVGQTKVPLLFDKEYQYEGNAYGAGVSYGYHLAVGKRWGVEFNVGVGAAYLEYDKYKCGKCGEPLESRDKWYFGPTKLGVSLVFMFK